jgi:two-component system, OmpR family, alkaline phosphatase synthesis response regulator PhoP
LLRVSIIADEHKQVEKLSAELAERGLNCSVASDRETTPEKVAEQAPDLVLVAMNGSPNCSGAEYLARRTERHGHPPVIALLSLETLDSIDPAAPIDDFVIKPWDATEVALRVKRTLRRTNGIGRGESIECGDLVIDLDNCEVTVDGRLVTLTFKEYELLRFLASNRGRVFPRDALLDEVWGHDYYGGDRTVDVHIRRLRSKIEDSTHTFIETVRNIGYRFKKGT